MKIDTPDLFRGISLFVTGCDYVLAGKVIQASRVNEHLCNEAEQGRAHGGVCIVNGCWVLADGATHIKLHEGNMLASTLNTSYFPFDRYPGGEPVVEGMCTNMQGFSYTSPLNGLFPWNTQNIYLRASVFPFLLQGQYDSLGINSVEYQQAEALGSEWGLTGKWGDKNRISEGNWHYDDSILTGIGDNSACHFIVRDARGCPQYALELFQTRFGNLLLPYRYLKRAGFVGPRRVFFAPEENIAIWGADRIANPAVKHVILTFDPGLLLTSPQNSNVAVGCFPGGVESITKSDLSVLKGKNCVIPVLHPENHYDVEFAVKLAAALRKKLMHPRIVRFEATILTLESRSFESRLVLGNSLQFSTISEIELSELCGLATQHNLVPPEELHPEYFCDITKGLMQKEKVPLISSVMSSGDIIIIDGEKTHALLTVAASLAATCERKCNFWPEDNGFRNRFTAVGVVDGASDRNGKAFIGKATRVINTKFLSAGSSKEMHTFFKESIGNADVVIFAATTLYGAPERFEDIVRWCKEQCIAVIIVALENESAVMKKLRRIADAALTVRSLESKDDMAFAVIEEDNRIKAVELHFDSTGKMIRSGALTAEKKDALKPPRTVAAAPFNGKCFDSMKEMPLEKRLPAIKSGNQKLISQP